MAYFCPYGNWYQFHWEWFKTPPFHSSHVTHTIFVVFLKTLGPALIWSQRNLKCNQQYELCRKVCKISALKGKGREVSRKRKTHDLGSFEPSDMLSPCNHNSSKLHKIAQVSLASQEMETGEQRDICSGTCHLDSTCRQMKQQGKRSRIYNVKGVTKSAL